VGYRIRSGISRILWQTGVHGGSGIAGCQNSWHYNQNRIQESLRKTSVPFSKERFFYARGAASRRWKLPLIYTHQLWNQQKQDYCQQLQRNNTLQVVRYWRLICGRHSLEEKDKKNRFLFLHRIGAGHVLLLLKSMDDTKQAARRWHMHNFTSWNRLSWRQRDIQSYTAVNSHKDNFYETLGYWPHNAQTMCGRCVACPNQWQTPRRVSDEFLELYQRGFEITGKNPSGNLRKHRGDTTRLMYGYNRISL
jgi:hypothetical protein